MFEFTDLYSKRFSQTNKQEKKDIYQYEEIPKKVRNQIIYIGIGLFNPINRKAWAPILRYILEEKGEFSVAPEEYYHQFSKVDFNYECYSFKECKIYITGSPIKSCVYASTLDVLDFCEIMFQKAINMKIGLKNINAAANELNYRFKEAGIGYEMNKNSFKIIRIDNQYIHKEVVKPALNILNNHKFEKANEYYQNAHKYYLENKIEACITECGKCFESVLKTICEENGWQPDGVTAIKLIECVKKNDLFLPDAKIEKPFTQFIEMLKNGLPPIRNMASHGTILTISSIPLYLASYAMHLTAANILLLQQAQEAYQHLKT